MVHEIQNKYHFYTIFYFKINFLLKISGFFNTKMLKKNLSQENINLLF